MTHILHIDWADHALISSMWVADISHGILRPMSLMMLVLGSPGCERLSLLGSHCTEKWLSLALQPVSDWACFVFKPAENGCAWLSRR